MVKLEHLWRLSQFFEKDSVRNKIEIRELVSSRRLVPRRISVYGGIAAKQLGVELTPASLKGKSRCRSCVCMEVAACR